MPEVLNILNLGAGVQSTAIYLMATDGEIPFKYDAAIMGDTGDEPDAVYAHLKWLQSLDGPPIHVVQKGVLSHDLVHGRGKSRRFAQIPAFSKSADPLTTKEGKLGRQCTAEYKIEPVEKAIREIVVGLKPRQRFPVNKFRVVQHFGISGDEIRRAGNILVRFGALPGSALTIGPFNVVVPSRKKKPNARASAKWSEPRFPLLELGWGRWHAVKYLEGRVPHPVPRSACVYCPFKSDWEWRLLKDGDAAGWAKAVELDRQLRVPGNAVNRMMRDEMYIHRSLIPLDRVDLSQPRPPTVDPMTTGECQGMCGV